MLTNPFTNRIASWRRKARRRAIARRGWYVQRLESRCVMAADFLGNELEELPTLDEGLPESVEAPSAHVSSTRFAAPLDDMGQVPVFAEPDVEVHLDFEEFDSRAHAAPVFIDLLSVPETELAVEQHKSLVFTWDATQLDRLLGSDGSQAVLHVVYDASRWQLSPAPALDSEFDFAAREAADTQPTLLDSTLSMLSLINQTVRVQVEVQPGNIDEGILPEIVMTLVDADNLNQANEKWTSQEFELVGGSGWPATIAFNNRTEINGSLVEGFAGDDSATLIDSSKQGDIGYASTEATLAGDESGETKPLVDNNATPLPESRREAADRSVRSARRTLDLRQSGAVSSIAPLSSRAPVTPNSLTTQSAIAGVYESDTTTIKDSTRWMLDPKPARLQVATFLISRAPHRQNGVATVTAKSPAIADDQSHPAARELALPTAVSTDSVEAESLTRMATVPSAEEVTAVPSQVKVRDATPKESAEESVRETPMYAIIVDRLLGSPVSLVAILGLTAIARFTDPDEVAVSPK